MNEYRYAGSGVYRSTPKQNRYAVAKTAEQQTHSAKTFTVLGVEVDKETNDKFSRRTWEVNGKRYSLLGVNLWATSKEIASAFPEDSAAARNAFASILDELEAVNPQGVATAREKLNQTSIEITGERVQKMKHENFVSYLEELKNIYQSDLNKRKEIEKRFQQAKTEYEESQKSAVGEIDAIIAKGNFLQAEQVYKSAVSEFTEKHYAKTDALRGEMLSHLTEFYRADPSKLDEKGMKFLSSGIATPAELEHLAEEYKANPTMLRVIGKHAKDLAEKCKDRHSKDFIACMRLSQNANRLAGGAANGDEIKIFDTLSELVSRGVCKEHYLTYGSFEKTFDKYYNELAENMKSVDRLS